MDADVKTGIDHAGRLSKDSEWLSKMFWKREKCAPLAGPVNAGEKSGEPVEAVRAVRIVRYCLLAAGNREEWEILEVWEVEKTVRSETVSRECGKGECVQNMQNGCPKRFPCAFMTLWLSTVQNVQNPGVDPQMTQMLKLAVLRASVSPCET